MCAWRQTRRDALKIGVMMEYIGVEHKKAFIFVTLTAPNVKGDMLSDEITRYNKAFGKLIKRDVVTDMNHGYIRKLEITYNRKRDDYHTHLHCVFAVDESYFTSRKYLSQSRWLELWRDVMSDENITQVDVRRVKKSESGKEVSELAKYAAKDSDYTHNQVVFDVFYKALKGRQVLTYNGIFTMANKKYKDGELDKYIELDNTEYCFMLLYLWGNGEYIEKKRRELSEEEQCVLNVRLEEMEVE
jgi:plasmid rolling circle replication initiator protein Rep